MSTLKVWNGTAFVTGSPRVWNGTAFVLPKAMHVWDGTKFVQVWSSFAPFTEVYTSGQLAAVANKAFSSDWVAAGTGLYVKGIGAGGRGNPGQSSVNTAAHPGGAGGAGFDEVFILKATLLAAGSAFNAKYGVGGNDGAAASNTEFSVGTLLLRAGGANFTTAGVCTVVGVTGVTQHNGAAAGANSTGFYGAGGGQSNGAGGFSAANGNPGGNSPTVAGGASNGGTPPSASVLEAGAGGGGGFTNNAGGSSVGGNGGTGGKFGSGGGGAGNGWAAPGGAGNGGDGGLQLRWV